MRTTGWIVFLILFFFGSGLSGQGYLIRGSVDVDQEIWYPTVYLSLIESFDDLSTISPQMIFSEARIDSQGHFQMQGDFLPAGERVYRLHICKQGDPLSTIIIGGKEHNHVHFAMQPGDTIDILSQGTVFREIEVRGGASNACLTRSVESAEMRSRKENGQSLSYEMREERAARALVQICRDCGSELGSLFAAYTLLQKFDETEEAQQLPEVLESRDYQPSIYRDEVEAWSTLRFPVLPEEKGSGQKPYLLGLFLVVPAALMLSFWVMRRAKPGVMDSTEDPLEDLSNQERRVLQLLANGMTNKEISSELNIEVNTVKSHVSSIYRKLNIRSRKEVHRFVNADGLGTVSL